MQSILRPTPCHTTTQIVCEKVTSRDNSMMDLAAAAIVKPYGHSAGPPAQATGDGAAADPGATETTHLLAAARAEIAGLR
jgi:hypothetical protein